MLIRKPFYFIRHGETDWNQKRLIQGHTDIPLNEKGIRQANESIHFLKNIKINKLVSSPLIRAKHTAEIINSSLNLKFDFDHGLKERNWGVFEGAIYNGILSNLKDEETPQGAETLTQFKNRIISTSNRILKEDSIPLIVAHGGVFVVLTTILGYPNFRAANCVPYSFIPENVFDNSWSITPLI
jgi:probable phosphoglycerate mutase